MKAIDIPSKKVEGWALPEMPGEAGTWRTQVVSVWYPYIYSTSKGSADING